MIVVDASAAIELLLRTSTGRRVEARVFSPRQSLHAPHLIDVEVAQVLRRYVAAGVSELSRTARASSGTPNATLFFGGKGFLFSTPIALLFDSSQNLWLTLCQGGSDFQGSALEFTLAQLQSINPSLPQLTPNVALYNDSTVTSLDCPSGIAIDKPGNLWVVNEGGDTTVPFPHIDEYGSSQLTGSGSPAPQTIITSSALKHPLGAAFDNSGDLWIADLFAGAAGEIFEYVPAELTAGGAQTAHATIASSSLNQPETVAFDGSQNLWTPNCGNNTVQMFQASDLTGSGTIQPAPKVTISAATVSINSTTAPSLHCPEGLALDNAGNLWVANYYSDTAGSIVEYTPDQLAQSGNPSPAVFLDASTSQTNVQRPFMIGFGPEVIPPP